MLLPDNFTTPPPPFATDGIEKATALLVLVILPEIFRVPPTAWAKVEVELAAPPRMIGALMVFVLFALIAVLSARVVWDDYRFGETSPGIGVPQWWYTVWLPVMSVAIAGRAMGLFIRRGRQA